MGADMNTTYDLILGDFFHNADLAHRGARPDAYLLVRLVHIKSSIAAPLIYCSWLKQDGRIVNTTHGIGNTVFGDSWGLIRS